MNPHMAYARYPSGTQFKTPFVELVIQMGTPFLLNAEGQAIGLDPRTIVHDEEGHCIYSPRTATHLPEWVEDWLEEHPEWERINASPTQ